jgi:gluconate 2-dehydrogenase gamma chain
VSQHANDDSPEILHRRELLRRAAWILGGAISAPAALAILQGCSAKESPDAASWTPKFFKGNQAELMTALADVIIPKTDTSGALDAGVPAFIDSLMADVYPKDAQERFSAGFAEFEDFLKQDAAARKATVQRSIEAALALEHEHKPFILVARELTLLGFFTSRVGITENMEYVPVPTVYRGCVPLTQMKKPVHWE